MKKGLLIFIGIGIVAQFGVIASILIKRELTLRRGEVYRFATAPVDPFDAFRGRYVALRFGVEQEPVYFPEHINAGKTCYARLGTHTNGFAKIEAVISKKTNEPGLLKVRAERGWRSGNAIMRVKLPFDRYYMPEKLAPEAELVYNEAARRGNEQSAAAVVRVWRGNAVIEDLEIDGMPVLEYLKKNQAK